MKDLVILNNQAAVTTSLRIAEVFSKKHKDVLKAIDNLEIGGEELRHEMFFEDSYESRGKKYRLVIVNRDGFTLLGMGFTGKKATDFKIQYIRAFNEMEKRIKEEPSLLPTSPREQLKLMYEFQEGTAERVDVIEADLQEMKENQLLNEPDYSTISKMVRRKVNTLCTEQHLNQPQKAELFKDLNSGIKKITGAIARNRIKAKDFDKVIEFINMWQPSTATLTIIKQMSVFE